MSLTDLLPAFRQSGLVRLQGLLPADRVQAARAAVLRPLQRLGLWRDDAWRLDALPRPHWPDTGLKTSRVIGNRDPALAALVEDAALLAAVGALLEGRPYEPPGPARRPQVLFTLPNAETWMVPAVGWHADSPRLASGQSAGVQMFAFLDPVGPGGGGPVAVAGSHRLLNHGRSIRPADFASLLRAEQFFADLLKGADGSANRGMVGDVPLSVVEMTGRPGDVWLMDLRVLHASAPNAARWPRVMLTFRYERSDLLAEVADAWGWA